MICLIKWAQKNKKCWNNRQYWIRKKEKKIAYFYLTQTVKSRLTILFDIISNLWYTLIYQNKPKEANYFIQEGFICFIKLQHQTIPTTESTSSANSMISLQPFQSEVLLWDRTSFSVSPEFPKSAEFPANFLLQN